MKLRVPGNFTGHYGVVEFKDGVSVRLVSPREANLLRAIMQGVEVLEDDGETVDEVLNAMSTILPLGNYKDLGIDPPSKYLTDTNGQYDTPYVQGIRISELPTEATATDQEVVVVDDKPAKLTMEQLTALVDKEGMKGLRAYADQFEVKGTSIAGLISELQKGGHVLADAPKE